MPFFENRWQSVCDKYHKKIFGVLRIKIINKTDYINIRLANGAENIFQCTEEQGVIYQSNTTNVIGYIIDNDGEYITIKTANLSNKNIAGITVTVYTDTSKETYSELILDENSSCVLLAKYFNNVNSYGRYLSRSEKLGSLVRGKTAIVFSDSLSQFMDDLVIDCGMQVIGISSGGCRSGYETGAGAGGESGTANSLWLCNDTNVQLFKQFVSDYDITNVDFIIQATGSNGTFSEIPTAEDLLYVLQNKRWYHDDLTSNPWDSLSDDDKSRFTSPACYIATFISMTKIFPMARAVCCELYTTPGSAYNKYFSDGLWIDDSKMVESMYNYPYKLKNETIKGISVLTGAIYVESGQAGENIINAPYYTDGVHPNNIIRAMFAKNIATKIGNPEAFE